MRRLVILLCLMSVGMASCHKAFSRADDFVGFLTTYGGEQIDYYLLCPEGKAFKVSKLEPGYESGKWVFDGYRLNFELQEVCAICNGLPCRKGKPVCRRVDLIVPQELLGDAVIKNWRALGSTKPAGEEPGMQHGEGMLYSLDPFTQIPKQCAFDFQPATVADLELPMTP